MAAGADYWSAHEGTLAPLADAVTPDDAARRALDELLAETPMLTRISQAKRLRDAAERAARRAGAGRVERGHLPAVTTGAEAL